MKTKLTLLGIVLCLVTIAQKNTYGSFMIEFYKVPEFPVTKMEGGTEHTINVTLEAGNAKKLQKEIDGINLGYNTKVKNAALTFDITFKEPTASIQKDTANDGTYFYNYKYETPCFVETKKDGKVVDTITFFAEGKTIKTISASPITIVDNYVKSPIFKIKQKGAIKNSLKLAIESIGKQLTTRYAYIPSSDLLTYNQYEKGAQNRHIDFTELNQFYNNYKTVVSNYKKDPEATRTKLNDVLAEVNKLLDAKTDDGKLLYGMESLELETVKLEILVLQYKFEEAKKQFEKMNSSNWKNNKYKKIDNLRQTLEKNYEAAKASGLEFKY